MRFPRFAPLALLPLVGAVAAACGTVVDPGVTGTTGSGGAGSTTATTATTTTASSTTVTASSASASVSSSSGTGGSDIGPPSDVYPAPHPAPPTVHDFGGAVLATPRLYPVFFGNDDPAMVMQLEDFVSKVGATQYWAATTSEYGVGAATAAPPVELTETSTGTIADADIQAWLGAKINGNDPAFPADINGIYILHYPAGVTITLPGGGPGGGNSISCQSFGGYHSNFALDGAHNNAQMAYAVLPRCATFGQLTGIDAVTGAEAHELIEASTDPFPMNSPAYADIDPDHLFWERFIGGGEVGDMCAQNDSSFTKFPELAYTVQRTWSNKAILAGHEPCVPAPAGTIYFNAAPVVSDNVKATVLGQSVFVKGIKIPVGKTKTVEVDLFSDADTGGPWQVDVQEFAKTPHLTLSLDQTSGQNGQKLHLTITVNSASTTNTETFIVSSTLGQTQHGWLGIVGN